MPPLIEGDMTKLDALGHRVAIHVMDPFGTRRRDFVHRQQLAHPQQEGPALAGSAPVRYMLHPLIDHAVGHAGTLGRHKAVETAQVGGLQIEILSRFLLPLYFKGARHPVAPAILFLTRHRHLFDPAG